MKNSLVIKYQRSQVELIRVENLPYPPSVFIDDVKHVHISCTIYGMTVIIPDNEPVKVSKLDTGLYVVRGKESK